VNRVKCVCFTVWCSYKWHVACVQMIRNESIEDCNCDVLTVWCALMTSDELTVTSRLVADSGHCKRYTGQG